jgi:hypothetical protein
MAESGPLAAYVTYRSHWSSLPNYVDRVEMPGVGNRKRVPDKAQRRPIAALICEPLRAPWGFKGSSPLLIWACSGMSFAHAAGVQGRRPP